MLIIASHPSLSTSEFALSGIRTNVLLIGSIQRHFLFSVLSLMNALKGIKNLFSISHSAFWRLRLACSSKRRAAMLIFFYLKQ